MLGVLAIFLSDVFGSSRTAVGLCQTISDCFLGGIVFVDGSESGGDLAGVVSGLPGSHPLLMVRL